MLLVGIGGFGARYVEEYMETEELREKARVAAVVDMYPKNSRVYNVLCHEEIPIYEEMGLAFAENDIDLVIISTPIHYHKEHIEEALEAGCYVLCEKPIAGSLEEAKGIAQSAKKHGRWVAIGYQWSFSQPIRKLKQHIQDGKYGKPLSFKSLSILGRSKDYFAKRQWAGRRQDDEGHIINDSIMNNAAAHQLHNMLFLLGEEEQETAKIGERDVRVYRANAIETFDTVTAHFKTTSKVDMWYFASHAVRENRVIYDHYVFEKGYVEIDQKGQLVGYTDNHKFIYGNYLNENLTVDKVMNCIEAIKEIKDPICTVDTAMEHMACVDWVMNNCHIKEFEPSIIKWNEESQGLYVEGLKDKLINCFKNQHVLDMGEDNDAE